MSNTLTVYEDEMYDQLQESIDESVSAPGATAVARHRASDHGVDWYIVRLATDIYMRELEKQGPLGLPYPRRPFVFLPCSRKELLYRVLAHEDADLLIPLIVRPDGTVAAVDDPGTCDERLAAFFDVHRGARQPNRRA